MRLLLAGWSVGAWLGRVLAQGPVKPEPAGKLICENHAVRTLLVHGLELLDQVELAQADGWKATTLNDLATRAQDFRAVADEWVTVT